MVYLGTDKIENDIDIVNHEVKHDTDVTGANGTQPCIFAAFIQLNSRHLPGTIGKQT